MSTIFLALGLAIALSPGAANSSNKIVHIDPPEDGFFTKELDFDGIPIKAPEVVSDDALFQARDRLQTMLGKLPNVRYNLGMAGAELQIIGKDQGTSDLPDFRSMKGKPFDGNLTIDQRTRGMGGRHSSCGEENLLKLDNDRYRGRDICIHEFGHCIQDYGLDDKTRQMIRDQMQASMKKGLWVGAYSASNESEFFAELGMWYFGTHGDLHMTGAKPDNGPEGLKQYDPDAYALFDNLYSGRLHIQKLPWASLKPLTGDQPEQPGAGRRGPSLIRFENKTGGTLPLRMEGEARQWDVVPSDIPAHGIVVVETRRGVVWDVDIHGQTQKYAATEPRSIAKLE